MKKQLVSLGTLLILGFSALPGSAACPCKCQSFSCNPCQCPTASPCCLAPIGSSCYLPQIAPCGACCGCAAPVKPCCESPCAMPCPAAPIPCPTKNDCCD